jgi:hypothetical protein
MVRSFVQVELTNGAGGKADFRHPIARVVAALKRRQEQLGLILRRLELDVGNQFHASIMERLVLAVKTKQASMAGIARPAIPPRPEGRGIARRNR